MHDMYIFKIYGRWTILLLIVSVYLHSLVHSELRKKLCCFTVTQDHSGSSKLIPVESLYVISHWSSIVTRGVFRGGPNLNSANIRPNADCLA